MMKPSAQAVVVQYMAWGIDMSDGRGFGLATSAKRSRGRDADRSSKGSDSKIISLLGVHGYMQMLSPGVP